MACCDWSLTLSLLAVAVGLIYLFLIWNFGYWKKRGVKEAKSYPLFGSFPSAFTQKHHMSCDIEKIYDQFKNDEKFVGVFTTRTPQLLILDPEYAHKIYVTDFRNFHDNEFSKFVDDKSDLILANNPFSLSGEKWRERRLEIVPGMTPNRIKNGYPVTLEVCERFKKYINHLNRAKPKDGIDVNELCLRFTSEVVTDCVLGIKAESLTDNPSPILGMTKKVFENTIQFIIYQLIAGMLPSITKIYKMQMVEKKVAEFFYGLMTQAVELREKQKDQVDRVDFLNYLIQLREKKNLTTPEMTSHTMTFVMDGFFTTAAAVTHCLLLLARDRQRQEKLRAEIMAHLEKDGSISFENLSELPYLDACLYETLRIFPAVVATNKMCTAPYELVNKNGNKVALNVGDVVVVPLYCIHHDEKYYENPEAFMPERFLPENGGVKKYREKGLYLGFGDGPRVCLGMRFAQTQAKAAIVEAVKSFNITPNPRTRTDYRLDPKQFLAMLDGGVHLDFEPIN